MLDSSQFVGQLRDMNTEIVSKSFNFTVFAFRTSQAFETNWILFKSIEHFSIRLLGLQFKYP